MDWHIGLERDIAVLDNCKEREREMRSTWYLIKRSYIITTAQLHGVKYVLMELCVIICIQDARNEGREGERGR